MKSTTLLITVFFAVNAGLLLSAFAVQSDAQDAKIRVAVVGLDHDHVWGLLSDLATDPQSEFVAIADAHPELVAKAKPQVPAAVKFYTDYVRMLDEAKPQAVIITTENDKHLEIVRECAKRHINVSTEKPMATNAADAREMERLANDAGIKLMVNYWNAWVPPSHALFHRVKDGDIGPGSSCSTGTKDRKRLASRRSLLRGYTIPRRMAPER